MQMIGYLFSSISRVLLPSLISLMNANNTTEYGANLRIYNSAKYCRLFPRQAYFRPAPSTSPIPIPFRTPSVEAHLRIYPQHRAKVPCVPGYDIAAMRRNEPR